MTQQVTNNPSNRNPKARGWCVTINNYTDEDIAYLNTIDCTYSIVGKETAPTTGTKHLQCFFYWQNPRSFNMVKTLFRNWHLEQAKGNSFQNFTYCSKDGDFTERGTRPKDPRAGGADTQQARWDQAIAAAIDGRTEDIPSDLRVRHWHTWHRIREEALLGSAPAETTEQHLWYYGPSGTGKSRKAREDHPDCYLKMCTKWWCSYSGQDTVVIEDFDIGHSKLVHHLKIWGDRYQFPAEVKGGSITIRPKLIIVTSNYHPREIWDREGDLQPILRRFKCVEFKPQLGTAGRAAAQDEVAPEPGSGGGWHREVPEADCETFCRPQKSSRPTIGDY